MRQEPVRSPKQERSQKRFDHILETAKLIIEEKGAAGMKMGDIAARADISIGSIYQYFPNKRAIVAALAESLLDANTQKNEEILFKPARSLIELSHMTTAMLDQYYELQRDDPVAKDIRAGYASDKEIQAVDNDDTVKNRDYIFEMAKHLFRPEAHEQAKLALLLIISLGGAAVAVAVEFDSEEGSKAMSEAKTMLYAAWEASILPLGLNN